MHKHTRAFVTIDLPPTWKLLRSTLKRNMKESLRRASNRLARIDGRWEIHTSDGGADTERAIEELIRLHRMRATVTDRKRHADGFSLPESEDFTREVLQQMVGAGCATIVALRIDGVDVAARAVLHGNGATFFSCSGLDPDYWTYGPGTALMAHSLQAAIDRGDRIANLSQHPEDSKLRWSETLEIHNEFMLVPPRRRARVAAALYLQLAAAREMRDVLRKP
jgi:CelD/BcsL family acetyltransferase involved in cellulose biosynthesis